MLIEDCIPPIPHKCLELPRDTSQMIIAKPKTFRRASKKILSGKSKKNPFINFGGNRQNIAKKMRELWEADTKARNGERYKLINRDLGGADAKIVAYLCRPGRYRQLFENDIKPHLYLALQLFPQVWKTHVKSDYVDTALKTEIPDLKKLEFWKQLSGIIKDSDDWPGRERYYYIGKKTGLSGNYGMRGARFCDTILQETEGGIILQPHEGDMFLHVYHARLFPEIQRDFQAGTINFAKRNGFLKNLLGWKYNLTGKDVDKLSEKDLNELYSWIPQSTVACITLMAYVLLQEYIEDNDRDWHILGEVHDAIFLQVPESEVEEAALKLKELMAIEMISPIDGTKFRMGSSCQVGYNLAPKVVKKDGTIINPEGLVEVNI